MDKNMPKRNRQESVEVDGSSGRSSPATLPLQVDAVTEISPATDRDPQLEATLSGLDIDSDFKDSIRAMTPDTRREVLNDIVRNQQQQGMQEAQSFFGTLPPSLTLWETGGDEGSFHVRFGPRPSLDEEETQDEEPSDNEERPRLPQMRTPQLRTLAELLLHHMMQGGHLEVLQQHLRSLQTEAAQVQAMRDLGLSEDVDNLSYEELLALEERIGNVSKGISSDTTMAACMTPMTGAPTEGNCAVCLEDFRLEGGTTSSSQPCAKLKNCSHIFHEKCLKQWLGVQKTCPVCKQEVLPQAT